MVLKHARSDWSFRNNKSFQSKGAPTGAPFIFIKPSKPIDSVYLADARYVFYKFDMVENTKRLLWKLQYRYIAFLLTCIEDNESCRRSQP